MPQIGVPELVVILVILLILFGAKRLPELARSIGSSARELKISNSSQVSGSSPVFMDHIRELQWRLAIVALAFLATGAAMYPFFDKIVALLLKPLGNNLSLVYLTPGGAFNFAVQVCIYACCAISYISLCYACGRENDVTRGAWIFSKFFIAGSCWCCFFILSSVAGSHPILD